MLGRSELTDDQARAVLRAVRGNTLVSPAVLLPAFPKAVSEETAPHLLDYLAGSIRGGWQPPESLADRELRARAVKRLKDKRDLKAHVLAYVMVNLLLVGIWAASGAGFFWPVFPILGWGIGIAFHIWDVVSPEPGDREIEAEMNRLRTRHP